MRDDFIQRNTQNELHLWGVSLMPWKALQLATLHLYLRLGVSKNVYDCGSQISCLHKSDRSVGRHVFVFGHILFVTHLDAPPE